jgi:glycosylphosphatidylinositol transamidase (GPIT) subunit GPI8
LLAYSNPFFIPVCIISLVFKGDQSFTNSCKEEIKPLGCYRLKLVELLKETIAINDPDLNEQVLKMEIQHQILVYLRGGGNSDFLAIGDHARVE